MAHYFSYSLLASTYYLDNRSNSKANTCFNTQLYGRVAFIRLKPSWLVSTANCHTLVLKIKPCMSKYKQLYGETANGSLYQL